MRCDATLRRTSRQSHDRALALVTTSAVLYLVALISPFLTADIVGRQRETTLVTLPWAFLEDGVWELALVVMFTAVIAPAAKIGVMLTVLLGLRTANPPRSLPRLFKWYERIGPWAMVEVFLLGVFVAFTRLGAIAKVDVGAGLYAVALLMVAMVAADYVLDEEGIWDRMEERGLVSAPQPATGPDVLACSACGRVHHAQEGDACTRCETPLRRRKPNSQLNTWALLGASLLLYIPANIYPVMTVTRLGSGAPSTILGGAKELLDAGMWPLALLVFVASIMVPVLKLASLGWMLIATQTGSRYRLRERTRLYRMVDFIGRWSMIDVFMLGTLVALVRAGAIANITPGTGAVCFASVVVLTMIAASCFDPRVMWDAAGESTDDAEAFADPAAQPRAA